MAKPKKVPKSKEAQIKVQLYKQVASKTNKQLLSLSLIQTLIFVLLYLLLGIIIDKNHAVNLIFVLPVALVIFTCLRFIERASYRKRLEKMNER